MMTSSTSAPTSESMKLEALQGEIAALRAALDEALDFIGLQMAEDRRRITALEARPQAAPTTAKIHGRKLRKVDAILVSHNNQPMSFADMGKMLGYPEETRRQNMSHLAKAFKKFPDRYEIRESKLGGKTIKLNSAYHNHLTSGGV